MPELQRDPFGEPRQSSLVPLNNAGAVLPRAMSNGHPFHSSKVLACPRFTLQPSLFLGFMNRVSA